MVKGSACLLAIGRTHVYAVPRAPSTITVPQDSLDAEHLQREAERAAGRDAPGGEALGTVSLVRRDGQLSLLACACRGRP
jgi:hypothetical protein